jgi:hypothetical protein
MSRNLTAIARCLNYVTLFNILQAPYFLALKKVGEIGSEDAGGHSIIV